MYSAARSPVATRGSAPTKRRLVWLVQNSNSTKKNGAFCFVRPHEPEPAAMCLPWRRAQCGRVRRHADAALLVLVMMTQTARVGGGGAPCTAAAHAPAPALIGCGLRSWGGAARADAQREDRLRTGPELVLALRGGSCFSSVGLSGDADDEEDEDGPPFRPEWKRRVLVTGGCGFMGSYLVDRLVSRYEDYLIIVLDVLDECGSLAHLRGTLDQPNCVFVRGDVMLQPRAPRLRLRCAAPARCLRLLAAPAPFPVPPHSRELAGWRRSETSRSCPTF
jgi:hypothetical protein